MDRPAIAFLHLPVPASEMPASRNAKAIYALYARRQEPILGGFGRGITHGFVLEFACQSDLDYYLGEDPVHLAFSAATKRLVEDAVVVDIRDGVLFGPPAQKPVPKCKAYHGSCHCGRIAWTTRLETAEHVLCHCDTSKKLGGGPYSLNAIICEVNYNQSLPKA
jgi:hypothetical protein